MGAAIGSGSVTANVISQTATFTPLLKATGGGAGVATSDIFTVTAGKTAYIVALVINAEMVGAAGCNAIVKDSDGNIFSKAKLDSTATISVATGLCVTFPPGYFPTLAATKKLQIQGTAAGDEMYCTAYYFEV